MRQIFFANRYSEAPICNGYDLIDLIIYFIIRSISLFFFRIIFFGIIIVSRREIFFAEPGYDTPARPYYFLADLYYFAGLFECITAKSGFLTHNPGGLSNTSGAHITPLNGDQIHRRRPTYHSRWLVCFMLAEVYF